VFDKTVQANEMHCISQGHPECEFQISPAEKVEMPDGGEVEVVPPSTVAPSEGGTGKALEGSKDGKGLTESKPVASETLKTGKENEPAGGPKKGSERDIDAGVEKAARIAKRKQGFWERLLKK